MNEKPFRVLIAKPGLDGHDRGAKALREARDGSGARYDPKVVEAFAAVLEAQGGSW
ncbi:MAG: hypothetical protein KGL74_07740 [Elusimicrobia bacterium]|nr:hypothetical protein [Elusimicrobiota bacterium]